MIAGAWLLLAALPVGIAGSMLFTHATWFYRDLTYLAYPWRMFVAAELQSGRFPLWNPYAYGGMPLFANAQSAVLSPLSLPFDLSPFPAALAVFTVAALCLLAAGGGLLARRLNAGRWGMTVMGAVASAGGFAVTAMEFPSVLGSFAWLPMAPLLARWSPALGGIAAALSWLAGYPAFGMVAAASAVIFSPGKRGRARAALLSIALPAVLLLPLIQLLTESVRWQEGIGYAVSGEGALPVRLWPGLFAPWLVERWRTGLPVQGLWTWWWAGLAATLLASWSVLAAANRRRGSAAASIIAVCLAVAAGRFSPVHAALSRVGAGLLRFPGQAAALALLAVGLLASRAPLRRRGTGTLATLVVCLELVWLAGGRQPVLPGGIFSTTGELTRAVRSRLGDAFAARFIASGRAQSAVASGKNVAEAWVMLQDRLPGMMGTARRIPDAGGFGEPMVSARQSRWVSRAFTEPTFDAAKPVLARLGVSAVVLPDAAGGVRLVTMDAWPAVFQTQGVVSSAGAYPTIRPPAAAGQITRWRAGFVQARLTGPVADRLVLNQVFSPGWLAVADGVALWTEPIGELWPGAAVPPGTRDVTWVYRPQEFLAGLLLSLSALAWLMTRAGRWLG